MRILVATDGSSGGRAAIRFTAVLVRAMRSAEVHVILIGTTRRDSILGTSGVPFPLTALPEIEREEERWAKKVLEASAREFGKRRILLQSRYIVPRDLAPAARAILREADRIDADLIVVGSEGHGALREWALGSVASKVTHSASRPVVIVRPTRGRRKRV